MLYLSKDVQEAHGATDPAAQDSGDHGVDPAASHSTVAAHSDSRHYRHQGNQDHQRDQQHAERHTSVALPWTGEVGKT